MPKRRPALSLAPALALALALALGSSPAAAQETVGGPFWQSLGDSTLTRLVGEALQANYDIRAAAARVREARAERLEARLDLFPTVTASGGYTRQKLASATFGPITGGGSFPAQDIWDGGLDAFWELDVFGRVRRNVQGRSALAEAAREALRDVQVALTAELASAYFDLRGTQEQLAVAQRNADNQRRTLEVTQQRLDAGRGTAFDTERARAQLASTLANIPDLESQIAAAQYRIGVLVGRPPLAVAPELETAAGLPALPESLTVESADTIARRRPDVRSAERRLAAQSAFTRSARAEYFPRVTLNGAAGFTSADFGDFAGDGTSRYAFGPVISWPALNLGRVKARADAARAREAEAEAEYQRSVLRALEETETALVSYRKAVGRLERLDEAASASERAAELARLRFEGGVADFLQVLDAQRTVLEAQDRLAQGRTDATTALVEVYRAVGGEWSGAGGSGRE
ncbi:MAG: efflux transporter outer membrane subunit [Gemmatimonadales bacterium]